MTTGLRPVLATGQHAAKEVRFPCFRPDGDGERRADHSGERHEAQVVRVKKEVMAVRATRAVDRAVDVCPSFHGCPHS